ncbi:Ubiquitin-conjugating enzyme E2 B [Knufia fluminis]|uniref:Ubiquitin-conjugating enzyme E2 B n=1 Tax=Knufia fluminis TaxID=191047 RepID=A0AAN8EI01_9EURO|nr:Ubiquitin-conjugating enzyme E2 B [Knufia fluminis]
MSAPPDHRQRRLTAELRSLKQDTDEQNPKLFRLVSTSDGLSTWKLAILPSTDSLYSGGVFELELHFSESFPLEAPTARFTSEIYHPNVDSFSFVRGDILRSGQRAPVATASMVVRCLLALLDNPDLQGEALNEAAAGLYLSHPEEYKKVVRASIEEAGTHATSSHDDRSK